MGAPEREPGQALADAERARLGGLQARAALQGSHGRARQAREKVRRAQHEAPPQVQPVPARPAQQRAQLYQHLSLIGGRQWDESRDRSIDTAGGGLDSTGESEPRALERGGACNATMM